MVNRDECGLVCTLFAVYMFLEQFTSKQERLIVCNLVEIGAEYYRDIKSLRFVRVFDYNFNSVP